MSSLDPVIRARWMSPNTNAESRLWPLIQSHQGLSHHPDNGFPFSVRPRTLCRGHAISGYTVNCPLDWIGYSSRTYRKILHGRQFTRVRDAEPQGHLGPLIEHRSLSPKMYCPEPDMPSPGTQSVHSSIRTLSLLRASLPDRPVVTPDG